MDVFFLLLVVILSELYEKSRRKDCVIEKGTEKNFCEGHHFLAIRPLFLVIFSSFLRLIIAPSQVKYMLNCTSKGT